MKLTATKQVIIMSCITWIVVVAYCLYHQGLKFLYRTIVRVMVRLPVQGICFKRLLNR